MYGNVLYYATLFFLKYSLFLGLVGLAQVWGGSEQGWVCSGRELYMCPVFIGIYFLLQPSSSQLLSLLTELCSKGWVSCVWRKPLRNTDGSQPWHAPCLKAWLLSVWAAHLPSPPIGTTYLVPENTKRAFFPPAHTIAICWSLVKLSHSKIHQLFN